jgi:hypothetical protein
MDIFSDVKEAVNIDQLCGDLGYIILHHKTRSPYNDEKTPSCHIYSDQNKFYDFSSSKGGSVIDFYMADKRLLEPLQAAKDLADRYHVPYNDIKFTPKEKPKKIDTFYQGAIIFDILNTEIKNIKEDISETEFHIVKTELLENIAQIPAKSTRESLLKNLEKKAINHGITYQSLYDDILKLIGEKEVPIQEDYKNFINKASDIAKMELAEVRYIVPDMIPEGLTLLAGMPKIGKSWMCLQLAIAVATGGPFMGHKLDRADVLYLSLEDNVRRLKSRLAQQITDGDEVPEGLTFATSWGTIGNNCIEYFTSYLNENPELGLIIIDTFARVKRATNNKNNLYDQDYASTKELKEFAEHTGVSILIVHHRRKQESEDIFNTISGSTGLTGSVDTQLAIRRQRGAADAELHITGRDVLERKLAMNFNEDNCTWEILGASEDVFISEERQEILTLLRNSGPLGSKQIAEMTGKSYNATRKTLSLMCREGQLKNKNKKYMLKNEPSVEEEDDDILPLIDEPPQEENPFEDDGLPF